MKSELTIVISGLNEEGSVKEVLTGVLKMFDKDKINGDVIFLNNHSTDNTGALADSVAKNDPRLRVIHRLNRPNTDLGSSLKEGISEAAGDHILIMDCDSSHDPEEVKNLFSRRNDADIIVGSRYAGGSAEMPFSRVIISGISNFVVNHLLGVKVKDISTGFKLYKRETLQNLNLKNDGFGLHVEILLKASNRGSSMIEVPIHYKRSLTDSTLNYRKQLPSYGRAVLSGIKDKFTG
jgi:glycosyltransferase involved in cell wall biosynthesis